MAKQKKQTRRDVSPDHHVARYCNPQRVIRDPVTKQVIGVFPQAFELRTARKETYVSAYCMETFSADDLKVQFEGVLAALRRKLTVAQAAVLARLHAGLVVEAGVRCSLQIRVRDRSSGANPGYCGIEGMPPDNTNRELLQLFAAECCKDVRSVEDIEARADAE
jgi:hypothetical protein